MTDHVPPQLCNLLKTYQCTATKSLQGPGLSMVHSHKKEILSPSELIDDPPLCPPPQPPQLSQPILTAPDTQRSILYETILEGKPIACFLIGGEMRLCVPQILNTILTVYKLDQIYKCCDELQISFSECTDEQLSEFKAAKILPENIKGSGLITRTNAERLCSALLHRPDVRRIIKGSGSFRVFHKCFGRCEGVCTPDLYSYKEQACIECLVCHGMYSPQRFVCHAHANRETQVCHWGFDSNNWRAYLHVSLDEDSMDKYTNMLDELSERESQKVTNYFVGPREGCNLKKKAPIDEPHIQITCKTEPIDIPAKKSKRVDDATSYLIDYHHQYQALMYAQYRQQQISAFRPWAQTAATITQQAAAAASGGQSLKHLTHIPYAGIPYLSQEPPVLQHPERVVPLSDCERFERSYQPNVALAPRKPNHISVKERDKDRGTNTINNTNNTINNNNSNTNNNTNRVIQMTDIQIKQERPSTPTPPATLQPSISITALHQTASNVINSPIELRISSSPNTKPNITNGPDHLLTNGSTSIVPQPSFSPETLSGSNEITSSTSPVLINIKTDVDCARSPVPIELHQTKIELRSPTIHHHHHHNHQHHNSIILKNANNGNNNNKRANTISGNSEFELSTDTDDDSLNGEPDSSNTNLPLEIASDIMKNCRPDEREKIIHLIRCLLQENSQLRHFVIDNQNELRRRDEQINELLQQQHDLEEQIRRSAAASLMVQQISSPNIETTTGSVIQTKMENIGTISQMDQTATTITRCLSPRKPIRLNHHQTEVIMKPLKKLLRRSPIDEMNAPSAGVVVIKKNDLCNNNRIGVVVSVSETTKVSISSQSPLLSSTGGGNNNNGSSTALSSTSSTTSSLSSPTASESNINLNNSNTSITRICSNNINNINNNNVSKTDDCNSNNNNSCSNKNNLKDNDHDHNDCDRNNTSPDSG